MSNRFRVLRLVCKPCTDQFRDLLRHYVPPNVITGKLHQEKKKKKSFLHKLPMAQLLMLCPQSGVYQGSYDEFDIPLIYKLLRNLSGMSPHSNGWGNEPDPNDRSVAANIERIRVLRNDTVHKHVSLSDSEFQNCWSMTKQIVKNLDAHLSNNRKYENMVDNLQYQSLDPEETEFWRKTLKKRHREETTCKRIIKKQRRE